MKRLFAPAVALTNRGFNALLEERLRATIETAMDAVVQMDAAGIIIGWNNQAEKIFGWSSGEAVGRVLSETIIPPQYREAHVNGLKHFLLTGEGPILNSRVELLGMHRDGHEFPVELAIAPIKIADKYEFSAFIRDITKRKQAERESAKTAEDLRIAAIAFETQTAMVVTDTTPKILHVNRAFEEMTGYTAAEAIGHNPKILSAPEIRKSKAFYEEMWAGLVSKGQWSGEVLDKRKNGVIYPKWLTITAVTGPDGTVTHYVGSFFDITERKKAEEEINRLAFYDSLTNLPNRRLFYDRLEQAIKKADRAEFKVALLFIDLDKFKEVNDTLGHSMGDLLLVEAARRIGGCVRETDTLARLGGDEFIVILAELDDIGSVERVAENILRILAEPFRLGDDVAYVSASIGITLYPDDATGTEELLKNADQAMYAAKNKGRNCFSYFTQFMQQAAQAKLRLINELRGALAANQFRIYYQPVVDMATGCINKAEALVRWQHPKLGLVSPAQFIPLAEETGLIVEIGDWVFRESARQLKHWRALCNTELQVSVNMSPVQYAMLQVSVNMSPVQFHSTNPYQAWSAYLRELGLPRQSMVIEITEGLLLDVDTDVTGKLLEFHDLGIQVAIDDFGTGYSALSYLKKYDIDYLKIDQSFVRNLATDHNDLVLSEAIIVMAHKLGLKVIAEGVETEVQCKLLAAAGCDYAQGYLFSRPVLAEEFTELLRGGQSFN